MASSAGPASAPEPDAELSQAGSEAERTAVMMQPTEEACGGGGELSEAGGAGWYTGSESCSALTSIIEFGKES